MDGMLPTIDVLKDQARRLRASLAADGKPVGHGKVLEMVAHQYGYRDWNTLHAVAGNRSPASPVTVGARVQGRYLGQRFSGEVIGVVATSPPGRFRVTLRFEEPVDVVTFDSFSAFRQRVTCVIDRTGATAERTSNGRPHMQLHL